MKWLGHLFVIILITHLGASGTMLKCGEDIVVGRGGKKNLRFWSSDDELLKVEVIPSAPPKKSNDASAILSIFKNGPNSDGLLRPQDQRPSLRLNDEGEGVGVKGEFPSAYRTSDQKIIPKPQPTEGASLNPSVMTQDTEDLFEPKPRDETIAAIRSQLTKLKEGTYDPERLNEALETIRTRLNVLKEDGLTELKSNDPTKYEEIDIPSIDQQDQDPDELEIKLKNEALKSDIEQEIMSLNEQVHNFNEPSGNIAVIRNQIVKLLGDKEPSEQEVRSNVTSGFKEQPFNESEGDDSQSAILNNSPDLYQGDETFSDNNHKETVNSVTLDDQNSADESNSQEAKLETVPVNTNSHITNIQMDSSQIKKAEIPHDHIDMNIMTKSEIIDTHSELLKEHQPDEKVDQIKKHTIDQLEAQSEISEDQTMKFVSGPVHFDQDNKPHISSSNNQMIKSDTDNVSPNQDNEPSSAISDEKITKFEHDKEQTTQDGHDHTEISTGNVQTIKTEADAILSGQHEEQHSSEISDGKVTKFEDDTEHSTQQGQDHAVISIANEQIVKAEADVIPTVQHDGNSSGDEKLTKFEDDTEHSTQQGQDHAEISIDNDQTVKVEADVIPTVQQDESSSGDEKVTKFEDDTEHLTIQGQDHAEISIDNKQIVKAEADVIPTVQHDENSSGDEKLTKFEDDTEHSTQQGQDHAEISIDNEQIVKAETDVIPTVQQDESSSGDEKVTKFEDDTEHSTQQGQDHAEISIDNDQTVKAEADVIQTVQQDESSSGDEKVTKFEGDTEHSTQQGQDHAEISIDNDQTVKAEADVIPTVQQDESSSGDEKVTKFEDDTEHSTQLHQDHAEISIYNEQIVKAEADVIPTVQHDENSSGDEKLTKFEDDVAHLIKQVQDHTKISTNYDQTAEAEADVISTVQRDENTSAISDEKVTKVEDDTEQLIQKGQDHIEISTNNDQTIKAEADAISTGQQDEYSSDINEEKLTKFKDDMEHSTQNGQDHTEISTGKEQITETEADAPLIQQDELSSGISDLKINKLEGDPEQSTLHGEDHADKRVDQNIKTDANVGPISQTNIHYSEISDEVIKSKEDKAQSTQQHTEQSNDPAIESNADSIPTNQQFKLSSDISVEAFTKPQSELHAEHSSQDDQEYIDISHEKDKISEADLVSVIKLDKSPIENDNKQISQSEDKHEDAAINLLQHEKSQDEQISKEEHVKVLVEPITESDMSHTAITIPKGILKSVKNEIEETLKTDAMSMNENFEINENSNLHKVKINDLVKLEESPHLAISEMEYKPAENSQELQNIKQELADKISDIQSSPATEIKEQFKASELTAEGPESTLKEIHIPSDFLKFFQKVNSERGNASDEKGSAKIDEKDESAAANSSSQTEDVKQTFNEEDIRKSETNVEEFDQPTDTEIASDSQLLDEGTVSKTESENVTHKEAESADHEIENTNNPEHELNVENVSQQEIALGSQPFEQSEISGQESDSYNHHLDGSHLTNSKQDNEDLAINKVGSDSVALIDSVNADNAHLNIESDAPLIKQEEGADFVQYGTINKTLEEETFVENDSKIEHDIEPAAMIVPESDPLYSDLGNEGVIDYSHYTDNSHLPDFETGFTGFDQYDSNFNDYEQKHNIKADSKDSISSDELPILNSNKNADYTDTVKFNMDDMHSEVKNYDPIEVRKQTTGSTDFTQDVSSGQSETLPETQEDNKVGALQFDLQDEQSVNTSDHTSKISNPAKIQAEIVRLIEGTLNHAQEMALTNVRDNSSSDDSLIDQESSKDHHDLSEGNDTSSIAHNFRQEIIESSPDVNEKQEFLSASQGLNTATEGKPLDWKLSEILTKLNNNKKGNEPGDQANNPIEIYPEDIGYNEEQKDEIDANINILKSIVNQVASDLAVNRKETESKLEADLKPINLVHNPNNEDTFNDYLGVIDYDSKLSDSEEAQKIAASNVPLTVGSQTADSHVIGNNVSENKEVNVEAMKVEQDKGSNNEDLSVKDQQSITDHKDNESLLTKEVEKQEEELINVQTSLFGKDHRSDALETDEVSKLNGESTITEESENKQIATDLTQNDKYIQVNDNEREVISIPFSFLNWSGKESETRKDINDKVIGSTTNTFSGKEQETLAPITNELGYSSNASDYNATDAETTISPSIDDLKDLNIMKEDSVFSKESGSESMITLLRESVNKQKGNLEGDKNTIPIPFTLSNSKEINDPAKFRINPVIIKEHESKVVIVTPNSHSLEDGDGAKIDENSSGIREMDEVTTTYPNNGSNQESNSTNLPLLESDPPSSAENMDYITDTEKSETNDSVNGSTHYTTSSEQDVNKNDFEHKYDSETKPETSELNSASLTKTSEKNSESADQSKAIIANESTKDPNFLTLLENYVIDESPDNSYIPDEIYNTQINENYHEINNGNQDYHSIPINKFFFNNNDYENVRRRIDENTQDSAQHETPTNSDRMPNQFERRHDNLPPSDIYQSGNRGQSLSSLLQTRKGFVGPSPDEGHGGAQVRKDDSQYPYGGDSPFFIKLPGSPNAVPVFLQYEPVEIKYVDADKLPKKNLAAKKEHPAFPLFKKNVVSGNQHRQNVNEAKMENDHENDHANAGNVDAFKSKPDPFFIMEAPDLGKEHGPVDTDSRVKSESVTHGSSDSLTVNLKGQLNFDKPNSVPSTITGDRPVYPGQHFIKNPDNSYSSSDTATLTNPIFSLGRNGYVHSTTPGNPQYTPFPLTTNPPKTEAKQEPTTMIPKTDMVPLETTIVDSTTVTPSLSSLEDDDSKNNHTEDPLSIDYSPIPFIMYNESFDAISYPDLPMTERLRDNFGILNQDKENFEMEDKKERIHDEQGVGMFASPKSGLPPKDEDFDIVALANFLHQNQKVWSKNDMAQIPESGSWRDPLWDNVKYSNAHMDDNWSQPLGDSPWLSNEDGASSARDYTAFYSPEEIPGLDPLYFSYRQMSQSNREPRKKETGVEGIKEYIETLPMPLKRAVVGDSPSIERTKRSTVIGEQIFCEWNFKTEPGLYLLVTFQNLSAPFTVDCYGAYIEVERESNGYGARWCGNRASLTGGRQHVIFAKHQVRISVYDNGDLARMQPTGFEAEIEAIDLFDSEEYNSFMQSKANSKIRRLMAG